MKLIECYIDNFGKLSDERICFSEGLNTICRENGWGKSTLSAFIKAMFYSLEETRRQSLDENERKRYTPWHGGRFGGSLTIEVGKKKYRIERSFAQKSADDTFALFDLELGSTCTDFSERIGEELFGIDADGFERTVFLSEKNISERNDNKSISAKLSDLVGTDGDVGVLDDALELLDSRRKFYYKKGGSGEIGRVEGEIARLSSELSALEALRIKCRENEKIIAAREGELCSLQKERAREGAYRERSAQAERRAEMARRLDLRRARLRELEEYFGERKPTVDDIAAVRRKSIEAQQLKSGRNADFSEYDRLSELFDENIDYATLEEMERVADSFDVTRRTIDNDSFDKGELEELQKKAEAHIEKLENTAKKSNTGVGLSLILVSVVLSSLAVVLGAFITPYLYALLAPVPFLIAFAVANFKKRGTDDEAAALAEEFLLSVGAPLTGGGVIESLRAYSAKLNSLIEAQNKAFCEREAMRRSLSELEARLVAFLSKFPTVDYLSYKDGVRRITALYSKYYALQSTKRAEDNAARERATRATLLEGEVNSFLSKYRLGSIYSLPELEEKISEHAFLQKEIERATGELSEFDAKFGELKKEVIPPLSENLDERISECERNIAVLKRQYDADLELLDSEDQKRASLNELQKKLDDYKTNLSVIQKTALLLAEAKDAMTARYLGGTKAGFERYVGKISGERGDYTVDTSFTVSKSERGSSKKSEAYSRGTRELYALAMRLALIDSLYESESPCIILDDPFTSFDDEKVSAALKLLREIAREKQVIYLTCSKHRSV